MKRVVPVVIHGVLRGPKNSGHKGHKVFVVKITGFELAIRARGGSVHDSSFVVKPVVSVVIRGVLCGPKNSGHKGHNAWHD